MSNLVVEIAVGISINKTFHYLAPENIRDRLHLGSRVLVPFGNKCIPGTVTGFPKHAKQVPLKFISEVSDAAISKELLSLAHWMADYYLYPLGQTIDSLVPKVISCRKPKQEKFVRLLNKTYLKEGKKILRGKKQIELVNLLEEHDEICFDELRAFSLSTIRAMHHAGILEIYKRDIFDKKTEVNVHTQSKPPELMSEQTEAVRVIIDAISKDKFCVFLLHGVTGSGKTEVYLHAIANLAGTGKEAIVLVPEIALTARLLSRFKQRFGSQVAVLHSKLTGRERAEEYRRIQKEQVKVVIGARSAVFAPLKHVGLIIVDEEHESSYKQDDGLRYHARDVAVMRAKFQQAVAVLGSATPSLESYYNAKRGKYGYLQLSTRVDNRPLPEVTVIDMKKQSQPSVYSSLLIEHIKQRLESGEQTLLLLNRRGFSSVIVCRECGAVTRCPSCSVSLTYHKSVQQLKCHYCGFFTRPPDKCSACSSIELKLLGTGTQKLEEELRILFPEARLRRMDSDTVKGRNAYDMLLQLVERREVDILLGTQMIAKGHDFPTVTLVGIVDADTGLNLPDFRSAEKTFQLITQAAGRAGRGTLEGKVIIQTMNPNHYSIQHSKTHNYEGFYNEEISNRTELHYPPLSRMIKLEIKSTKENYAAEASKAAQIQIRSHIRGKDTILLGPAPAPISRVRGLYRYHLILLSQHRENMRLLALEGKDTIEQNFGRKCKVTIDVDPVNLM
ncbi:MAG TPA: primosomal protein N' [Nitrospirota bacterium]|nr:primosomal protein N' [Nitrospirota bacterium]